MSRTFSEQERDCSISHLGDCHLILIEIRQIRISQSQSIVGQLVGYKSQRGRLHQIGIVVHPTRIYQHCRVSIFHSIGVNIHLSSTKYRIHRFGNIRHLMAHIQIEQHRTIVFVIHIELIVAKTSNRISTFISVEFRLLFGQCQSVVGKILRIEIYIDNINRKRITRNIPSRVGKSYIMIHITIVAIIKSTAIANCSILHMRDSSQVVEHV